MSNGPLTTYLRMYRRRTGLSQADVAYLLGIVSGTTLSRHEMGSRVPVLKILLAYQAILGVSIAEIYEGDALLIDRQVRARAQGLRRYLERQRPTRDLRRRIAYVSSLENHEPLSANKRQPNA